jgi:hypothetical protein
MESVLLTALTKEHFSRPHETPYTKFAYNSSIISPDRPLQLSPGKGIGPVFQVFALPK